MNVKNAVYELIGNTPLLKLNNCEKKYELPANVFAKLEYFNPSSSVKDRTAKAMIDDAEKKGLLKKGSIIIEPTSGNTGIGLASIGASKGYEVILTMPETMSEERKKILRAYGAKIVLTEGSKGMNGAIQKATELAKETPNSFIPSQFDNFANPEIHEKTTGVEIYSDLDGKVDAFVAGVGTGGTITGVAKYLKSKNPNIKIYAVEPSASPVLSGGTPSPHKLQGIGAGFVPTVFDATLIDEIITVTADDAYNATRNLAKLEGILCGISSGAALHAGFAVAKKKEFKNKNIVVLLPDTGERYLSTELFL